MRLRSLERPFSSFMVTAVLPDQVFRVSSSAKQTHARQPSKFCLLV